MKSYNLYFEEEFLLIAKQRQFFSSPLNAYNINIYFAPQTQGHKART
jgi:hypothetical protein